MGMKSQPVVVTAVCRGEGVGYLSFATKDDLSGVEVQARLKDGRSVSSACFCLGATEWVAVLPLLAEDVVLSVRHAGSPLATITYPAFRSKLYSRLLTRTRPDVAANLRGIERRRGAGRVQVSIDEAWPLGHEQVVWRIHASFPMDDGSVPPSLVCYDERANALDVRVVVMEDHVVPQRRDASLSERLVTFSCVLPQGVRSFFAVASSGEGEAHTGFAGMNAPRAGGMLMDSHARISGAAGDASYGRWFEEHRATTAEIAAQQRVCASLSEACKPLISIVMPVFRTPKGFLREAIDSVLGQSYERWELLVVNVSGACDEVDAVLGAIADDRVRVLERENLSISQNTNAGIEEARGDYVAFLDHDDVLEPDALWHYVQEILCHPEVDLLYCDEDRLVNGSVQTPAFKTFPNYGKLYTHNYVTHLLMVSRYALEATERSDARVAGAQDYDLTLKAFEVARRVTHIPRVLYHWREHEGSTAGGDDQKPYAHEAGRQALLAHLDRRGIAACVDDGPLPYTYRVCYELPEQPQKVSIVIPTRDQALLLRTCVTSILERTTYQNFEIVLVENNSEREETFELYDELRGLDDRVRVVTWKPDVPGDFNYSAIVNHGAANATGELLVLLNNDTEVLEPAWLEELAGCLMRPEVGVVGAKLLFGDDLVQHVGMVANPNGDFCHVCQNLARDAMGPAYAGMMPSDYAMVTGACQMVSRALFDELGGYDETLAVGFNDGDFCLRARELGYTATVAPYALLRHREFSTRGRETTDARLRARYLTEKGRMLMRHAAFFAAGDPALNPNLNGFGTFFEL